MAFKAIIRLMSPAEPVFTHLYQDSENPVEVFRQIIFCCASQSVPRY